MKKTFVLLCLLFFVIAHGYSQKIEYNVKSFYGAWNNERGEYFYGGGEFEIVYESYLKKGDIRSGIAFRSIDWGNQVSLIIGYQTTFVKKKHWVLSGIGSVGAGLALFYKQPLFVWSIGYMPELTWLRNKRFDFNLGIGIRYSHSPAYKNYGSINQLLEFPLKIGAVYKLNWTK